MRSIGGGCPSGFSLLELMIALFFFQVGLMGVAGMLLVAQKNMIRSQLMVRGTLAPVRIGDSLLSVGEDGSGELSQPWGRVSWEPVVGGGLHLVSTGVDAQDTLYTLVIWPKPETLGVSWDSLAGLGSPVT